jgi:uncharacterized SAM-binding protein YcdF (DUF218 family)
VSLGALPTALLIPPVNLVPLAIAGLVIARFRPRLGRALTGVALAGLFVLGLPATSILLMDALEMGLPRAPPTAARLRPDLPAEVPGRALPGAIVVLSGDGAGTTLGGILPPYGPGGLTLERMQAGVVLARRLDLPLLVTGGSLSLHAPPIAAMMASALQQDFGISAAWIEPQARDTWENAKYSARILAGAGIRSVYLVTHGWHMRRALIAFRHFGLDAVPVAVRIDGPPNWEFDDFVPTASAWVRSYYAIHEWIGCLWYALRA